VPVGFGHGFLTLSESAEVLYKASGYWSKSCERSLRWNDPDLAIAAPMLAEAVAAGEVLA
jgi:dTDP-4-dehydrorhamnose 3,5-epimerase